MAKRRRHGQGGITQRTDGIWAASVSLGTGPDGKRLRKTVYGATKEEAERKLRELRSVSPAALAVGDALGNETTGEYLHRWLAARKPTLAPNTYACYSNTVRTHLVPELGSIPLRTLAAGHIQALLAASQTVDQTTGRPRRSARMTQLLRVVLRLALDHEGHWNRITAGVSRLALQVPSPRRSASGPDGAWTAEEAGRFLKAAAGDPLEALWLMALTTGMRQGEMLGLQWSDIDWKTRQIHVQRTLVEIDGKIVGLFPPKTESGDRYVELTEPTIAALQKHRARLLERGLSACPQVFPTGKVRGGPTTTPAMGDMPPAVALGYMLKNRVRRHFGRIMAKTVPLVSELTFHQLRHTAGTLMLKAGVDTKIVSYRLGHTRVEITANLYQHVQPEMQREAAAKLDAVLGLTPGN